MAQVRVPTFVVIGGGSVGSSYVRQILRALAAGRLETDEIRVVDRDPGCLVGQQRHPRVRLEVAEWSAWLDAHLDAVGPDAHLVPYHWAPHLLEGWLARQVEAAGGDARRGGEIPPRRVPFELGTRQGDRALSYATWACPPMCIEPELCPHTRGPRDWSLAGHLARGLPGDPFDEPVVFRCLHFVYGVGTIALSEILASRDRVVAGLGAGRRTYLVATSSHCHALATVLAVMPRQASCLPVAGTR